MVTDIFKEKRTKKAIIIVSVILALLVLTAVIFYVNIKNFTVKKVLIADGQEVYLMGTFHNEIL